MMYEISFEKNGVYQANLIDAPDARTARDWFEEQKPDATICGIDEFSGMMKPGIPVHCVPDGWKSLADRIKERQEEIYAIITDFQEMFDVLSMDSRQLKKALHSPAADFEDMLQYQCARAHHCDLIITRNGKHFRFSEIGVATPKEYLASR